jgi:acetoin utilization protein AcuB
MKNLLVRDWMIKDVVTVEPDTPMLEAHQLMRSRNIRRVPVVKRGKVVGIVTRSDVREASPSDATTLNVWEMNYLLAKLKVREIMTSDVITIHPEETLKEAAIKMYDKKIGALPVVDKHNNLVGILTESDIFRILIAWFNEEVGEA